MKKESFKFGYLPIVIIILCSIGIYFIYYYKQKEFYNNFVENFLGDKIENFKNESFVNNQDNEKDKIIIENALNNVVFTKALANGLWTTNQSNYKDNKVTNLMKIDINDELKGTIDYTSISPGKIYNITNVSNMLISGENRNNKNETIVLEFKNEFLKKVLERDNVIEGFVEKYENEENIENFESEDDIENFENEKDLENFRNEDKNKNDRMIFLFIKNYLQNVVNPQKIEYYFKELRERRDKFSNILQCKVSMYTGTTLNLEYFSYKIFNRRNTGGLLSRLILSKQFYNLDIPMKYNLYLYNKYLKRYQYPPGMVKANYSLLYNKNSESKFIDNLEKKYANQLYICYQREFLTIKNEVLRTPLSRPYIINIKDRNGLYFANIEIKAINPLEKKLNKIADNFTIRNTIVYFYKMIGQQNSYSFSKDKDNQLISQFNFKNDANTMFNKNNITFPNLFKTINTNKSTYNLTFVKSYKTLNDNSAVQIPYKDIKMLI